MGGVRSMDKTPGVSFFTLGMEKMPQSQHWLYTSSPWLLGMPLDQVCVGWMHGKPARGTYHSRGAKMMP